ncbi:SDR family NAD(P)-dependent oxidoreductase [Hyphobacterium sp. HN65]|uniref:SDR family NAD(P)-dependent oxidoreductase n=1 Tax=Hyphobacterium lacteum TaxID=3116575 RepID=A0ABU7LLQ7_9PROT|nr:SDR family NAD(P)-dependent oxidoreductase [Hyphobacterium sp. HN65]MEE2524860.1 SDR family NAD(P)-dependent oxidoreductase [Hyphobacterium sp. HN65]
MSSRKTALVTGANRGIGLAIARGLSAAGLDVIVGARKFEDAQAAAETFGARAVQLDVSNEDSIEAALAEAGPIDVLVNNAGVLSQDPVLENPEAFDQAIAVMLKGPYELIRRLAPGMVERGYGRIVNLSSEWGSFASGLGGPGPYGLAKAALNGLTIAAARDLPDSVKINAMCPGWVQTRMGGAGATLTPEEGADTAIWLATLPDDGPTGGFFQDRKPHAW